MNNEYSYHKDVSLQSLTRIHSRNDMTMDVSLDRTLTFFTCADCLLSSRVNTERQSRMLEDQGVAKSVSEAKSRPRPVLRIFASLVTGITDASINKKRSSDIIRLAVDSPVFYS